MDDGWPPVEDDPFAGDFTGGRPSFAWRRFTPSRHDHVGAMRFGGEVAVCGGCGQEWRLGEKGWRPVDPSLT